MRKIRMTLHHWLFRRLGLPDSASRVPPPGGRRCLGVERLEARLCLSNYSFNLNIGLPVPTIFGGNETLIANVVQPSGAGAPGSVTFFGNGASFGAVPLDGNGRASITVPLNSGEYTFSATYNPAADTTFPSSTATGGNPVTVTAIPIVPNPTPFPILPPTIIPVPPQPKVPQVLKDLADQLAKK